MSPIDTKPDGRENSLKAVQPEKDSLRMAFTVEGMSMRSSDVQPLTYMAGTTVDPSGMLIDVSAVQPENWPLGAVADSSVNTSESGTTARASDLQLANALMPMNVTRSGISTSVMPVLAKAFLPMDVSDAGNTGAVSAVQPENTYSGSAVTSSDISTEASFVQFWNIFSLRTVSTFTLVSDLQFANADAPTDVTVAGNSSEVIPVPEKALAPTLTRDEGNTGSARDVQPEKMEAGSSTTESRMLTEASFVQPLNMASPNTAHSTSTLVSAVQPWKAFFPTLVTDEGTFKLAMRA